LLSYPARIIRDGTGYTLVFRDLPFGGHTCGQDKAEALSHAPDALRTALSLVMEKGMDIPLPRVPAASKKSPMVSLPSIIDDAKVELYRALKASGLPKAELARRMRIHRQQVERLLDLDHASRIEQLELAFRAIGKRLVSDVRGAVEGQPL
jgi:antitoxin HicB